MSIDAETKARMQDVKEQAEKVAAIHARMMRGEKLKDLDGMIVRRLIRLLVAEWV